MIQASSRSDLGTTLVELLVAMAIMVVIFTVVLPIIRAMHSSLDAGQLNSEQVQNARIALHHIHKSLSTARRITAVSDPNNGNGYIEFQGSDEQTYRYELSNGYIRFGQPEDLSDLAGRFSGLRFVCYSGRDLDNPITDVGLIRLVTIGPSFAGKVWSTSVCLRIQQQSASFSPGVAVTQTVKWIGGVIDSYDSSEGPYDPGSPGSNAVVSTNSSGANMIQLSGGAILRGDAYVGPNGNPSDGIKTYDTAQITGVRGVLEQEVEIPNLFPPADMPPSEGPLWLPYGTYTLSSDRRYARMLILGTARLVISGQIRIQVDDFCWIDSAELEITPGSSLELYAGSWVLLTSGARLNCSQGRPSSLRLYMYGNNDTFSMWNAAQMHAILQNPRGTVQVWTPSQFFGKIKAKSISGNGQIHVDVDAQF